MATPPGTRKTPKARKATLRQRLNSLPPRTQIRFSQEAVQAALPASVRTVQRQQIMEMPHLSGQKLDLAWHIVALLKGNALGVPHWRSIDCIVECGNVYPCRHRPEGCQWDTVADQGRTATAFGGGSIATTYRAFTIPSPRRGGAGYCPTKTASRRKPLIQNTFSSATAPPQKESKAVPEENGRQSTISQSPTLVDVEEDDQKGSQDGERTTRPSKTRGGSKIPLPANHKSTTGALTGPGRKRCHCLQRKAQVATA